MKNYNEWLKELMSDGWMYTLGLKPFVEAFHAVTDKMFRIQSLVTQLWFLGNTKDSVPPTSHV